MGTRRWADVRRTAAADEPARQAYRDAIEDALELARIRERFGITQIEMAARLGVTQGNVSRLERREDVYLSTIREYVEALGGQLKVVAVFPGAEIPIARGGQPVAAGRESDSVRP